ncbi:MAG: hypothetical protein H6745_04045 [Deltaproteobacteria bacterium]|nr:hypothetical protein [Deltaproteobacteria bacterium]
MLRVIPILTLLLAACASAPPAPSATGADQRDDALVLVTDRYELHLKSGQLVKLTPTSQNVPPAVAPVGSYGEFRELYEARAGEELPEAAPPGGVEVAGWRDLECVRDGQACGREPADPAAHPAVKLRLAFPR